MELESFDSEYVQRLTDGDLPTERHFTQYFGRLLGSKLRRRLRSPQDVEDVAQETLLRVFHQLRHGEGLREPEKLGAYVNSVCNYVLLERYRDLGRHPGVDPERSEPEDDQVDLDRSLVHRDRKRFVQRVLEELSEKDQILLRMIIEERDKAKICEVLQVTPTYLRVLLHRAKTRFREIAERDGGPPRGLLMLACVVNQG